MQLGTLRSGDIGIVSDGLTTAIPFNDLPSRPRSMVEVITEFESLRHILAGTDGSRQPVDESLFNAPVLAPSKIWAAASNYERGAETTDSGHGRGDKATASPAEILEMAFLKPPSAIIGPGDAIVIPEAFESVFPELELCVVIGRRCRNVDVASALDAVFGYTIVLDVTARGHRPGAEARATRCIRKGFDTFAPLGPWIATRDEVPDPQALAMRLTVNDETRQSATTGGMINDVATLVSYLSTVGTLEPGDLIATGNPDSPTFQVPLRPGDIVRAEIERIGAMTLSVEHRT